MDEFSSVAVFSLALGEFCFKKKGVGSGDALGTGQPTENLDVTASPTAGKHRYSFESTVNGDEDN
ncbi:hypothetical protein CF98_02510 [Halopseudomonas bauzanensis]|nr:hypothetical protein CF98_02510 [Halopseudomonas bauzanensis]